jgi:hypothetical protein
VHDFIARHAQAKPSADSVPVAGTKRARNKPSRG